MRADIPASRRCEVLDHAQSDPLDALLSSIINDPEADERVRDWCRGLLDGTEAEREEGRP